MSDTALKFKNMRLVADGFGTDNCELPIIPRYLRQVCVDLLKYKGAARLALIFPKYRQMLPMYKNDLFGDNTVQNPGSWLRAERHVKSLNTKQRNDMSIYYGNIMIKSSWLINLKDNQDQNNPVILTRESLAIRKKQDSSSVGQILMNP